MRIQFQIKEKLLPIYEIEKKQDILIIGGIEVLIKSILDIPQISLELNGIGTKLAFHLKKFGLSPVIFDFLGDDEFLDLITKQFEKKEIMLFFSRQPYGTKRVLKTFKDNNINVFKDYRSIEKLDYNFTINNLSEIYNQVKSVYLILHNWDTSLTKNIKLLGKFLFLDFEESIYIPINRDIYGDFIFTNDNIELGDNIKYLYNVRFLNNGKIKFELPNDSWLIDPFSNKKDFLFEAKCAFKSTIINSLFDGKNIKDSLLLANIAYSYALDNKGKMISKNQLFEEYYKRK
ncbi:hypothetical protein [Marinitoga sp. 38H-ov]|uniref:hypothetical protein n=1 Tax=Marinitoga sp. 38H-ov TaxID=1755814 RepID=UPI0013EC15E7|nr:hypothetical protein [Marinitoga sp. 38H-ov]KAF2956404.1 hypothetical protein AS160_05720 [Marinitoga sp. 38H-ov]